MSEYVITIVPVTEDGFSGPAGQMMVRVDIDGGHTTVKELTMRAHEGSGLAAAPYVNVEMLVAAFTPPEGAPATAPRRSPVPTSERAEPKATARSSRGRGAATRNSRTAAGRRGTGGTANHLRAGRAYRKAPDLAELEAAYLKTGTIAGVADEFGVPVHTAQGWITRMRRKNSASGQG